MQNPQLTQQGGTHVPAPMDNEFFVLSRDGVSFSAKSGRTKVEGSGTLFLSTMRLVCVSKDGSSSFDIPLATTEDEKFNQPIFGANNMTGTVPPLDISPDEKYKWCVKFNNGGVGSFLPFYFRLLAEMRARMQQQQQQQQQPDQMQQVPQVVAQSMMQAAFVDPSDPTKFYVPAQQ